MIHSLLKDNVRIEDEKLIADHVEEYFKKLYMVDPIVKNGIVEDVISKLVEESHNVALVKIPGVQEILYYYGYGCRQFSRTRWILMLFLSFLLGHYKIGSL